MVNAKLDSKGFKGPCCNKLGLTKKITGKYPEETPKLLIVSFKSVSF